MRCVLIGIEPIRYYNADGDVKDGLTMDPSFEDMDRVFKAIDEQYHMKAIARTVRYVHSGSNNSLKAFYYADGKTYESKTLNFEIVDRVGGGDAFSSGLIHALQNDWKHEDIVTCSSFQWFEHLSAAILTSQALTRLSDL